MAARARVQLPCATGKRHRGGAHRDDLDHLWVTAWRPASIWPMSRWMAPRACWSSTGGQVRGAEGGDHMSAATSWLAANQRYLMAEVARVRQDLNRAAGLEDGPRPPAEPTWSICGRRAAGAGQAVRRVRPVAVRAGHPGPLRCNRVGWEHRFPVCPRIRRSIPPLPHFRAGAGSPGRAALEPLAPVAPCAAGGWSSWSMPAPIRW